MIYTAKNRQKLKLAEYYFSLFPILLEKIELLEMKSYIDNISKTKSPSECEIFQFIHIKLLLLSSNVSEWNNNHTHISKHNNYDNILIKSVRPCSQSMGYLFLKGWKQWIRCVMYGEERRPAKGLLKYFLNECKNKLRILCLVLIPYTYIHTCTVDVQFVEKRHLIK